MPEASGGTLNAARQEQWSYAPDGDLLSRQDQNGVSTYTYDADNNMLTGHQGRTLTTSTRVRSACRCAPRDW